MHINQRDLAVTLGMFAVLSAAGGAAAQGLPEPAPVPAPAGPPMTLVEAIACAIRHNPRIGEAAALVRESQARVMQRRAVRGPQAGMSDFITRQGPVVPGFRPGSPPAAPPYRYSVGVNISQIIFDWGQRRAA